jgi:uncharacterized protein
MKTLLRLVVEHPWLAVSLTIVITLLCGAGVLVRGVAFNGSPETLAKRDGSLAFFKEIQDTFGDDRVIIVAFTTRDVFEPRFLTKLDRLTTRLASLNQVSAALSLTNVKTVRREEGGIVVERLVPRAAMTTWGETELRRLKESVTSDPLYVGHYVSRDGRTTSISVFLDTSSEGETRAAADAVEQIARSESGGDEMMLAGVPIMDARGIRSMVRDMLLVSPLAALLCFLVFLIAFRSLWGAALLLGALVMGLVWVTGLMSWLGYEFTIATVSLPTVLLAVGSSYMFHILNQYRISIASVDESASIDERRRQWITGLRFIGPAVIVSGTTTMAGFGALASSTVPTARDMGLFEAIGIFFMLVLSLGFVPAVLSLLRPSALGRRGQTSDDYARWLNKVLRHATALILFRRRSVLVVSIFLTIIIGAGVLRLRVNTDYLRIFPPGGETVMDAEKLHERLAGAAPVMIVVSGQPGAATDPVFLRAVARLEEFAAGQPGVDATISIADIVERIGFVTRGGGTGKPAIPDDPTAVRAQFDEYLSQDSSLRRLVNRDGSRVAIILRTHIFSSNELKLLTQRIDQWSRANLPSGVSARPTGSVVLLNNASDAVARSQTSSLAIAVISIYLMMVIMFRSPGTGLLALIPNLLPIIGYFGFLGWAGITLDITSSLIASAVLGLAVDNAVHMIRRYRQAAEERGASSRAERGWSMWLTMLRTGKPIVLANLMLIAAFLLFMLSSFVPVRIGGLLWAVTIFGCLAADLMFLPALIESRPFEKVALGRSVSASRGG